MRSTHGSTKISRVALVATAAALVATFATAASNPATAAPSSHGHGSKAHRDHGARDLDARAGTTVAAKTAIARSAAKASARPSTRTLARSLGGQALVDIDGTTGTPRTLARLDGFLTRASAAPARRVALRYVRTHLGALGLTRADLATLSLRRDYVDVAGTHHLSWVQTRGGLEVFGNGLQAAVTGRGRLLSLGGSPVSGLDRAASVSSTVRSPAAAIAAARRQQGETAKAGPRDNAKQVLFVTRSGTHLGWRVITMSAQRPATTVIDAHTGRVLYRKHLGADESSAGAKARAAAKKPKKKKTSAGLAFAYFPKHKPGGTVTRIDFTKRGWLSATATKLSGNNSHTYSDVNDDNLPGRTEEVPPKKPHSWSYTLKPFHLKNISFCDHPYPCSWDPNTPYSWRVNRKQNATQVFSFVNNWHDHLLAAPIGFTEAAGNFQVRNTTKRGLGADAVDTQTDDGANTDGGLPDGGHVDNANMDTPPDGQAPTMQMYLQHTPGTTYPDEDPFSPTNVGDEADTVYHEYTHGLSHRLVIDASGNATLGPVQGDSMGEAWSDWYAMDYLVAKKLQADVKSKVDVVLFQYDGAGVAADRTEPIDCKVGSTSAKCNGGETGHPGGYTYADYGKVIGFPEVHADGEIWAQTLWDLRDAVGSRVAESLVTRAMEFAPADPSFLDQRNDILLADTAVFGRAHQAAIWKAFAHRGMGYYAGSLTGSDTTPGADFHVPPTTRTTGHIRGVVTDSDTGLPAAGVPVTLAFQGGRGIVNPTVTTKADGSYDLGPVPTGTYPKLVAGGAGYNPDAKRVTVTVAGATVNFSVRRDWVASSGGATITDFNGPDYSPQCGPYGAIDQNVASGWGSTAGDDDGTPTNQFVPKHIVVDMQQHVNLTEFAVDPTSTCGDGGSASTGAYRIETSPDGSTWTTAAEGAFTVDDRGRLNTVVPTAGTQDVRYVRFTILGNQTPDFATNCPDGAFDGCSFADLSELEAFGGLTP